MKIKWSIWLTCSVVLLTAIALTDFCSAYVFATMGPLLSGAVWTLRAVFVVVLLAIAILNQAVPRGIFKPIVAYSSLIAVYCLVGLAHGVHFSIVASTAETLCLPIILLIVGYFLVQDTSDLLVLSFVIVSICVATTLFGAWDVENTDFWLTTMQLGHYLNLVKGVVYGFNPITYLPWNFTGYLGVRRAAGLLAAPLAQGMYLAYGCVLVMGMFRNRGLLLRLSLAVLFALGIYQSATRGAMITAGIALALFLIVSNKSRSQTFQNVIFAALIGFAALQIFAPIFLYTVDLLDDSSVGHTQALITNLQGLGPVTLFGYGVGTGGAIAADAGLETFGAGEGSIFTIIYQTGIPGGLIFLWLYYSIIRELWAANGRKTSMTQSLALASWAFAIGFTSTFMTSEHAFSLSGGGTFWLMAGAALRGLELQSRETRDAAFPIRSVRNIARKTPAFAHIRGEFR